MYDLLNTGLVFTDSENEKTEPYTTNLIIARQSGFTRKYVNSKINHYKDRLEQYGVLPIETDKPNSKNGGRPIKIYRLSRKQAGFLFTTFDNTPLILDFKWNLMNAFVEITEILKQRRITHANSKPITKSLGQAIKDNPNITNKYAYSTFNKLIYKQALGMNTHKLKETRSIPKGGVISDYLTVEEQQELNKVKNLVISLLDMQLDYQAIKQTIANLPINQIQGSK